jgi:predicted nucleic-acid-binding Zn-ribbon protein
MANSKEKIIKCINCGSKNYKEEQVYWSTGNQFITALRCKDCKEFIISFS